MNTLVNIPGITNSCLQNWNFKQSSGIIGNVFDNSQLQTTSSFCDIHDSNLFYHPAITDADILKLNWLVNLHHSVAIFIEIYLKSEVNMQKN